MDATEFLDAAELMTLYADYQDALIDIETADIAVEKKYKGAEEMQRRAAERAEAGLSDLDALEVNAYIVSKLLNERFAIVKRLREQQVSWAKIGKAFGMSRQAAQQWHDYYHLRQPVPNPTKQLPS